MTNNNYTDILVDIYEVSPFMSANREEATDFYINEAKKNGEKVLEFGTATGLLTIPLAKNGLYVETVDISKEMHHIVEKKIKDDNSMLRSNINLVLEDMITYKNESIKFDTVIIADNALLAADTFNKQIKVLKNAYNHLKKGGKLILDIFSPDIELLAKGYDIKSDTFYVPNLDKFVFAQTFTQVHQLPQILDISFTHDEIGQNNIVDKRHVSNIKFRYIFPMELILMLNLCKFKINNIYGDFNYGKRKNPKSKQILIAEK